MKIIKLKSNPEKYSCNSYLLLGDWNAINDVNALIDTGSDGFLIDEIENLNTGVGKKRIDMVVFTHNHFDHTGGVNELVKLYNPQVCSAIKTDYVTRILKDGELLVLGDRYFEVIHTPGHSSDSICLYCQQDKILFSGDTPLDIKTDGNSFTEDYFGSISRLAELKIRTIYPGHGDPILVNAERMIHHTYLLVKNYLLNKKTTN